MTEMAITLDDWMDRYATPALLDMAGLPDTVEGRATLDALATALVEAEAA